MPNRSAPPGSIVPVLAYPDVVAAADWLGATLGFRVRLRIGRHRIQLVRDAGSLVVHELDPGAAPPSAAGILLRVDDVDATLAAAIRAGATGRTPAATHPYGERQAGIVDPWGHAWTLTQSVADVDPATWGAADIDLEA